MRHVWSCLLYAGVLYYLRNAAAGDYARLGGHVTVTWAMSPIKEFIVKKDYRVMFQITGNNKVTITDKELRTRINVNTVSYTRGTFSFHLYNVTSSDAGQYSCYVDSPFPPYRRVRKANCGQTLHVVDFQDHFILFQREHNGTVNLACNYRISIHPDSYQTVFVEWRENDARLYGGERNHMASSESWNRVYDGSQINLTSTLIICDGWQENYRYKCRIGVEKIHSEWSEEISPIRWSDDNKNYTVVPEGDDAMMTWKMPSMDSRSYITSPSGPHLMWKLSDRWNVGDTYISRLEIRGTRPSSESVIVRLLLHNITGSDAGEYLCVSGHHHVPQCGHTLVLSRSPEQPNITTNRIHLNQEATLTCSSTSRSLPQDHNLAMTYSWRRDNTSLLGGGKYQMSGPNLTIADVKEEDTGKYSCQSTEHGGQVSGWSSEFVLTAKQNIPFPTIPAISFIIGCSLEVIILLAIAAVVLHSRKANRDNCNQRFRDYYITATDNTSTTLHQVTDRDNDVIEDTYMPHRHPAVPGSKDCQDASCVAPIMHHMPARDITYPDYDVVDDTTSGGQKVDDTRSSGCQEVRLTNPTLEHPAYPDCNVVDDMTAAGQKVDGTCSSGYDEIRLTTPTLEHETSTEQYQGDMDYSELETGAESECRVDRGNRRNNIYEE